MKNVIFVLIIMINLTSCFKKEDAIDLPSGNTIITSCFLGNNYEKQMYFDLSSNTFQEHQLADWDLCFQSTNNGFGIFRNSGYNITVRKINIYNLDEPKANDTAYILQQKSINDEPNGKIENSAFGDWRNYFIKDQGTGVVTNGIYVIELSYLQGIERFRKMQILGVNDSVYAMRITKLNQTNAPITEIKKDFNQNFTYYSFKNNGTIIQNAEPNKNTWDFVITQYRYTFFKNTAAELPNYPVRGVLNNPNNIEVYRDSAITDFDSINGSFIKNIQFSKNRDAIGFDWKDIDYGSGANLYRVNSKITYIIKDTDGYYYKLRFLDFYNENRQKGYPKFEYIRIK
jgi:hypothetical protein